MTVEQAKSELMQIYGMLSPDKQRAIDTLVKMEPCEDCISRKSIKQKLQEHHDFFVNAYGGFSNLPQNDKSRVDEITNCIAMVVNEPPVNPQEPKTGHWIEHEWEEMREKGYYRCSVCNCGYQRWTKGIRKSDVPYIDGQEYTLKNIDNYCPNCGARMESEE